MSKFSFSHSMTDLDRLDYFDETTLDLSNLIGSLQRQPILAIKDFCLNGSSKVHCDDTMKALSSLTVRSLSFRCINQGIMRLGSQWREVPTLEDVKGLLVACPNLESLSLTFQPQCPHLVSHNMDYCYRYNRNGDDARRLSRLKELHLNGTPGMSIVNEEHCLSFLTAFQWSSIEKLSISNERLVEILLPRFGNMMDKLRSLRVSLFCSKMYKTLAASEQAALALSKFLATKSLVELELDGFTKDSIPVYLVGSLRLRKLRLHMWEKDPATAQANLRSAKDIRKLAELAPNLEHLMLDIGRVGKLWHPTAIPGVDVDVHPYQVFDALSKFSRLKVLHLFPRFHAGDPNGQGSFQQAIQDDGQAVQIFKHLKAMRPSLELLILSSDTVVAWFAFADVDPMSWKVCQWGDNILLRVRQANKDYEQKQIWQGQRRLRTEINRYSYCKPYMDGVGPRLRRRLQS